MGKDYLKKETIMVVDDSEADVDALVECLSGEYRVKVAMDGASALEDIKKNLPDIILLDVIMPGIDGFEVCRRIKQNNDTKDALVIFVTALTEQIDETKGLELGAIDYIIKPFNFAIIRAKVNTHLELVRARKELKRQNEILRENMELREQVEQISRHDLRNPLQVILGSAQLLRMEPAPEKSERDQIIENQISACDTMADMINRTMDLYKMEKGIYDLDVKPVDIMPLLDQLLLGLKYLIQPKGIQIVIGLNQILRKSDDRFIIPCDEFLFYSMMSNLLKNAIEASPGEEKIDLSFVQNELITIHIQNRGTVYPGIRDRFFEKFVSFGKHNGTGLGTYSASLMAQLHGGRLALDTSDRENKTTLSIYLPKLE